MTNKEFYWTRLPGKIIDKHTGKEIETDNVEHVVIGDWYETLIDLIYEVSSPEQNYMTVGSPYIMSILSNTKEYVALSMKHPQILLGRLIRDGLKKDIYALPEKEPVKNSIKIMSAITSDVTEIFVEM